MRFDVGLMDRLFGKRVTIEVPTATGTRSVAVTEKWLAQMEREGKMSPMRTVTVRVVDSLRGEGTAEWVIGRDVPRDVFDRRFDPKDGCLFAIVTYVDGKPETRLADKDTWMRTREIAQR
jgi:hypothetical protein